MPTEYDCPDVHSVASISAEFMELHSHAAACVTLSFHGTVPHGADATFEIYFDADSIDYARKFADAINGVRQCD